MRGVLVALAILMTVVAFAGAWSSLPEAPMDRSWPGINKAR